MSTKKYIILSGRSPYYGVFYRHPLKPLEFTMCPVGDGFSIYTDHAFYTDLNQAIKDYYELLATLNPTQGTYLRIIEVPLKISPTGPWGAEINPELTRVYPPQEKTAE